MDRREASVVVEIHTDRELPTEWQKRKMRKAERERNAVVGRGDARNRKIEAAEVKAPERRGEVAQASEDAEKVEMKILRICPNPRLVECSYVEEGEERRCLVRVGRNANFRRGMKLVVKRPVNGTEAEPWVYDGLLPRRPGHW
jgi:hypothetical protein